MRLHVMNGVERNLESVGDRLAKRQADEQRPDETRPSRGSHRVDLSELDSGRRQGLGAHRRPVAQVLAGRDLGNHPTERSMRLDLARNDRRKHPAGAVENSASRVIAGGFDAQNQGFFEADCGRRYHRAESVTAPETGPVQSAQDRP